MGGIPGSFSTCGGVNESAFVFLGHPAWQVALLVIPGQCCWSVCLLLANSLLLSTSVLCGSSGSLIPGEAVPWPLDDHLLWLPWFCHSFMSFLQRELRWFWDELHWQKSPGSRKWELQIKQRRFLRLPSQFLPGPSERRLGEGGRQERVEGCWNPFREASAFVCFVIAYLSGCLLGLVKVKIRLFPSCFCWSLSLRWKWTVCSLFLQGLVWMDS